MKTIYDILVNPLITEKGSGIQADHNQYVFKVASSSNKQEIKEAVEKIYTVKVLKVRTMMMQGKLKRVRYKAGRTATWKKAIVSLKPGDKIEFA